MAALTGPPVPLPPPNSQNIAPGITLLHPQSRRGYGPGMIVVVEETASGISIRDGVPSPLMKWAEEGYCVAELTEKAWEGDKDPLELALQEIERTTKTEPKGISGLVCYDVSSWKRIASSSVLDRIKAAVLYTSADIELDLSIDTVPLLIHWAGELSKVNENSATRKFQYYGDQTSHRFATPFSKEFHYATEAVSHTRSLTFLKKHMNGPHFDLEAIWEEHTFYEFGDRSVENTMNTMVQEPYVNHIPTIMGGIGRAELTAFYRDHFHFSNPKDAELVPISRTVGVDRVVDEFIFKCTHDQMIDWLLPGAPATNHYLEVPMMAVVCIRGDRLYHEHIHWDHATALKQAGLIPEYVLYPQSEPHIATTVNGTKRLRLPVAGVEGAHKLRDKSSVPSNEMLGWGISG